MKAKGIIIFLILMILFSFIPVSFSNESVRSYTSGNDYLKMSEYSENYKLFYVRGLMDATYVLLSVYKPEKYLEYKAMIEGMHVSQLVKILDKYLEENPEILHYGAADIFLCALDEIVYK